MIDIDNVLKTCKEFNKLLTCLKSNIIYLESEISVEDAVTQDYLHQLELCSTSSAEKSKIATSIKKSRKRRREAKDRLQVLTHLNKLVQQPYGETFVKQFEQVYGAMKREYYVNQNNRTYVPRVVKSIEKEFKNECKHK